MVRFGRGNVDVVKKWGDIGFLENAIYPEKTAIAYEMLGDTLIHNQELKKLNYYGEISVMAFPILFRLINHRHLSFDTIELINFLEKLNNDYRTIDGMHSSYTDVEAEFASFFAETYVK